MAATPDLTVPPELSELLQRTTELAASSSSTPAAAAVETQQQQQQHQHQQKGTDNNNNACVAATCRGDACDGRTGVAASRPTNILNNNNNNNKRRRPSSAGNLSRGGSASYSNLRLRRAPSHCPSCSGAPFTDATFFDDDGDERGGGRDKQGGENDDTDNENATTAHRRDLAAELRFWLLENGRAVSAPLLALLVVAVSVTWSLFEYAGSSAAALAGPALYAAKACVATSQACYG